MGLYHVTVWGKNLDCPAAAKALSFSDQQFLYCLEFFLNKFSDMDFSTISCRSRDEDEN
jgi:hypothetical protein